MADSMRENLSGQFETSFPSPGTKPIPEGHVRLFHYTSNEGLAGIKKEGLKLGAAKGESYGEPNQVWASAGMPKEGSFHDHNYVEFHADPKDLDIGNRSDPKWLEESHAHVTLPTDVPKENIVGIHQPWHATTRYVLNDEGNYSSWIDREGAFGKTEPNADPDTDFGIHVARGLRRGFT